MIKRILGGVAMLCISFNSYAAQIKTTPESVVTVMEKAIDWQLKHLRDDYNRYHKNDNRMQAWTFATLWVGMLEWAAETNNEQHYAFLKNMADETGWNLGWGKYNANEMGIGHLPLELYKKYKDPKMMTKVKKRIEWIKQNPSKQPINLAHYKHMERWTWCDALFMAPPLWSKLSQITGDESYNSFMFKEFKATTDHLFDPEMNLFYRDEHYITKREHGRKVFWSRGNGWVFGALPLIIRDLPEGEMRDWFIDLYKHMATSLAKLQTKNGHWAISLLCDDIYPNPETSGTAFFVQGFAWGINSGILNRKQYEPLVMKGWNSLLSHINDEGKFGYVQEVGEAPGNISPDATEVYGVGALLLAGAEVHKMVKKK